MTAQPMDPKDVPEEILRTVLWRAADDDHEDLCDCGGWPTACTSGYTYAAFERGNEAHVIAAVIPLIRAQVADEIAETMWADPMGHWTADQADAARAMKQHIIRRLEGDQ